MHGQPLTARINTVLAAGKTPLPVYPPVARQVLRLLHQNPPAAAALTTLISQEPALTCSLLRAANSAFYHGLPKVATIAEALTRIGHAQTVPLLTGLCRDRGDTAERLIPHYLPSLWQHALGCALGAGWLARRCGYPALEEEAHLAGLLHDIGRFFLLAALEQLAADDEAGLPLAETLIAETLASMHPEIGRTVVLEWNLPDRIGTVITRRHETDLPGQEVIVMLVRLAVLGCRKLGLGCESEPGLVLPATAEAQLLGIDEIALAELEIMLEDRFGLAAPNDPQGA